MNTKKQNDTQFESDSKALQCRIPSVFQQFSNICGSALAQKQINLYLFQRGVCGVGGVGA